MKSHISRGGIHIYQVDAFTNEVFGGNPAGVVPDARGLSDDAMQKMAREMNLSETAFVLDLRGDQAWLEKDAKDRSGVIPDFEVRFFTPKAEVDLCGHATIATFWLLTELGLINAKEEGPERGLSFLGKEGHEIRVFQKTKAGVLPVDLFLGEDGEISRVMMGQNLPFVGFTLDEKEIDELERILGAPKFSISDFCGPRPQAVSTGLLDLIVPLSSRDVLFSMSPDMVSLADYCSKRGITSVHCFTMETIEPTSTVHCRDFAPSVGIPEESATGTASGATAAYLVLNSLVRKDGPVIPVLCEQGYIMGRPSSIYAEIDTDGNEIVSVRVGGAAVIVMEGIMKKG
jgi:trans-2,3-dihydro-3-hydroxyanthranilate isomerase